ncbi:MAG: amino acid ABC transporter permease [Actinomycetota bacterium]|nr:amino acid ABC transporter permease [Actinomycetota bacterium]
MTNHDTGADHPSAPVRVSDQPLTRRQLWLRRKRRKALLVAVTSTIVVFGAAIVLVNTSSGWPKVKTIFFNGERFREDFPEVLSYLWVDVKLFLQCAPFILIWGLVIALCRNTRNPALFPLRAFAAIYTDFFRGVPIILTIYLVGFGIPKLGLFTGEFHFLWFGGNWNSVYLWGPVALVLAYSAYVAEVFRSGIDGVHESQRAGARSLGLSHTQTMRYVVLPQAARRVIPPLMNDFLSLQKDVALLSVLGIIEVFRRATSIKDLTGNFTPLVAAAVIFLALTIPETRLVDWYTARQRKRTGGSVVG